MNDNSFIDTNVLVYCYTDDEPDKSKKALVVTDVPTSFISIQVLTELANTLQKKFDYAWNEVELAISEVGSDFNVYVNKPATIEQACRIADKYKYKDKNLKGHEKNGYRNPIVFAHNCAFFSK